MSETNEYMTAFTLHRHGLYNYMLKDKNKLAFFGFCNKKRKKERNQIMKELTPIKLWFELIERGLFTFDELKLLTDINGFSVETLNDAIYARYGYRDLEQMLESEN